MTQTRFAIISTLLVALGLCLLGCGGKESIPSGSGFIEATEVVVSAEVSGRVEHLYVDEGDRVEAGMPIALIDTTTLTLKLRQAQAERAAVTTQIQSSRLKIEQALLDSSLAAREFERVRNLMASGSVREQRFDQVKTSYQQASLAAAMARSALAASEAELRRIEARIGLIRKQLADCKPRSPITGTIVTKYIERGELAAPGKPLVRIANLDTVWVKIYLNPQDLGKVRLGANAEVDPEIPGIEPLKGRVTWIAPEAEFTPKNVQTREARADLVYAVKVTVPNTQEQLKIGMPVMVRIPWQSEQ